MAALINLAGQKFGKWTVIKRTENSNTGKARWLCKCECGSEYPVASKALRQGTSTQCKPCAGLKKLSNLKGKTFGRLKVLDRTPSSESGQTMWRCECECGNQPIVQACNLKSGHSTQCRSCQVADKNFTHGLRNHPLYEVWCNMKGRCSDTSNHRYGGRGISVCSKWADSFQAFYDDMIDGYDESLQIDRIDNDGNYEPGNCRWLTGAENVRNSSLAKLTMGQVIAIRMKSNYGISVKRLATEYNISTTQIYDIVKGKSWKNIVNEKYMPPRQQREITI